MLKTLNTCWAKCVGRGPTGPPGPDGFPLGLADPGLTRWGEEKHQLIFTIHFLKCAFVRHAISLVLRAKLHKPCSSKVTSITALTCRSLQICLGNDWACQRTESLSFPSVSPENTPTRKMHHQHTWTTADWWFIGKRCATLYNLSLVFAVQWMDLNFLYCTTVWTERL